MTSSRGVDGPGAPGGTRGADLLVRRRDVEPDAGTARQPLRSLPGSRALRPVLRRALGTFCVATDDTVCALTYDDGPDPVNTPAVLDVLASRGARATFFVMAAAAEAHPSIVRRILDDGHELALHGRDHARLTSLSHRDAVRSVVEGRERVEQVAGRRVTLYRPPYGAHRVRDALSFTAMGLETVIWSGVAVDWVHDAEEAIVARASAAIHPGGILLMHDARADPETLGAGEELPRFDRALVLEHLLDEMEYADYSAVTVGDLLAAYPRVRSLARERMR